MVAFWLLSSLNHTWIVDFLPLTQSRPLWLLCFLSFHFRLSGLFSDLAMVAIFLLTPYSLENNAIVLYFKKELGSKGTLLFPFSFFIRKYECFLPGSANLSYLGEGRSLFLSSPPSYCFFFCSFQRNFLDNYIKIHLENSQETQVSSLNDHFQNRHEINIHRCYLVETQSSFLY